jgi:hypothetical protein
MTINSRVIRTFLQWTPEAVDVPLMNGLRIQIISTLSELSRARKHQFAAFIADSALLIVWDDDPLNILLRAKQIETELMQLVWKKSGSGGEEEGKEAKLAMASVDEVVDEESGQIGYRERRPTMLLNTILVSFTLALIFCMLGAGYRQIAIETAVDGNYLRLLFVVLTPVQVFFTLVSSPCSLLAVVSLIMKKFFAQVIIGCLAQCFGPVSQMTFNSKYYSAKPPIRIRTVTLPHVTIQCPVYKEGLESVISPTMKSIKQAISTYELQGGTANIFINDDGLQLLDSEKRQARIDFYTDHNIGWVARPRHGENGFMRRGKFKKVSFNIVVEGFDLAIAD